MGKVYKVTEDRLLKEYHHHVIGQGKGIMNWFNKVGETHVLIDVSNVTYWYSTPSDEVSTALFDILKLDYAIFGVFEADELYEGQDE